MFPHARGAALVLLSVTMLSGCRSAASRERAYLQEGRRYQQEGKVREAAIEFGNAVRLVPNDVEAHLALARAYASTGATQLAVYEFSTALQLRPEELAPRVELGELLVKTGQTQAALDQARWVVFKQPANAAAQELRAAAAGALGLRDEAMAAARAAVLLAPSRPDYHTRLALLLQSDPKTRDQSIAELQRAIQLDANNVDARTALAHASEARGDLSGAERQLSIAVQLAPRNVEARTSLAALYLRAGNPQQAEDVLQRATDNLADDPAAAPLLERFYQQTGHTERARAAYEALSKRHPNSLALRVAYVRVLMNAGDSTAARPLLERLVQDHGSDPDVTLLQGYALLRDGKNDAAVDLLRTAVQQYPERSDLAVLLGQALEGRGDTQEGLNTIRRAAQIDAADIAPQQALAEYGYRTADPSATAEAAEKLLALHPTLADGYLWRGVAELQKHQPQDAVTDLQEALERRPGDVFGTVQLGLALRAAGAAEKATAAFQQALAASPDPAAADALASQWIAGGKPQQAVAMVQSQIERAPRSAALYRILSQAQLATGDASAALSSARHALELAPDDRSALQIYTEASMANGQIDDPLQRWQAWNAAHPKDSHGPAAIGALYEAAGDLTSAISWYRRSLSLQGNQPELSAAVATLTAETGGNLDVALSVAQGAYRAAPDSAEAADAVGWINYRKGLPASALPPLRAAAALDPSSASILYHLALTEAALGDAVRARTDLDRARTLTSDETLLKAIQAADAKLTGSGA